MDKEIDDIIKELYSGNYSIKIHRFLGWTPKECKKYFGDRK